MTKNCFSKEIMDLAKENCVNIQTLKQKSLVAKEFKATHKHTKPIKERVFYSECSSIHSILVTFQSWFSKLERAIKAENLRSPGWQGGIKTFNQFQTWISHKWKWALYLGQSFGAAFLSKNILLSAGWLCWIQKFFVLCGRV